MFFAALNIGSARLLAHEIGINMLVEPSIEVDYVYPFRNGVAAVRVILSDEGDFRLGYVNRSGQFVIPFRDYPPMARWQTPEFSYGLVALYSHEDSAIGFFDVSGAMVIPFLYDRTPNIMFTEGLAAVSYNGRWGFIDVYGDVQVPFEYDKAGPFQENLAPVLLGERWGFINLDGNSFIPAVLDDYADHEWFVHPGFQEGNVPMLLEGHRWGFLSRDGNRITPNAYVTVEGFSESRALVSRFGADGAEYFGFIDLGGEEIVPLGFTAGRSFFGGLAAVRYGAQWGFIDHYGNVLIPTRFDYARSFSYNMASVRVGDSWGFVDRLGNTPVPIIYDEVQDFAGGLAAVRQGAEWGFVDQQGNIIVPPGFLEVQSFNEGLAWVRGEAGWGILELTGYQFEAPEEFTSRYIYQETPDYMLFRPEEGALGSVYDAITAEEAIFYALRGMSANQRRSGDALNIATLFIENVIRRGTTQYAPEDGEYSGDILRASALTGLNIWQDSINTITGQGVELLRPLALNLNFTTNRQDAFSMSFPDEMSGIAFDNIIVEAPFVSVSINSRYITRGDAIIIEREQPTQLHGSVAVSPYMATFAIPELFPDGFTMEQLAEYLREYWAVLVILALILLWLILALMGHKFRLWVVPTFAIIAVMGNLWTLGWFGENGGGAIRLQPGYFHSVTVTMSPGMRGVISIPLMGQSPDSLVIVNERGEAQLSTFNPVTDTMDARISTGGTFTLRRHAFQFTDISGLHPVAQDAIESLTSMSIMHGYGHEFAPANAITRAEFAAAIVRALDLAGSGNNIFPDNEPESPYFHAINTAAEFGLLHGLEDGNFRGGWAITKIDMVHAVALGLSGQLGYHLPDEVRTAEILAAYHDHERIALWAEPHVALVSAAGVMIYREDGLFAPDSVVTRGDAAVLLYRLFGRVW